MSFHEDGFAVVDRLVPPAECDELAARVSSVGERVAGSRCLLDEAWCREAAARLRGRLAEKLDFAADLVAVQCTYFHKSGDKNWLVAWHQDRSIPVAGQVAAPGLTGWSRKEGMTFVQAPDEVLAQMFAVRLHLDSSTPHNGPLRVVAGSHRQGSLSPEETERARTAGAETTCLVPKGGVLVMRPLLLHASSKSTTMEPRRVLHFLFGPAQLSHGLAWRCAV